MSEPLLNALIAAEAHIRVAPHGDNCFLHDDGGEFDACFCGKDALLSYLEGVLEDAQLAAAPVAAQEPDAYIVRTVERAIKEATQPQGMGLYDGMARIPASILARLLKLASQPAQGEPHPAEVEAGKRGLASLEAAMQGERQPVGYMMVHPLGERGFSFFDDRVMFPPAWKRVPVYE